MLTLSADKEVVSYIRGSLLCTATNAALMPDGCTMSREETVDRERQRWRVAVGLLQGVAMPIGGCCMEGEKNSQSRVHFALKWEGGEKLQRGR